MLAIAPKVITVTIPLHYSYLLHFPNHKNFAVVLSSSQYINRCNFTSLSLFIIPRCNFAAVYASPLFSDWRSFRFTAFLNSPQMFVCACINFKTLKFLFQQPMLYFTAIFDWFVRLLPFWFGSTYNCPSFKFAAVLLFGSVFTAVYNKTIYFAHFTYKFWHIRK